MRKTETRNFKTNASGYDSDSAGPIAHLQLRTLAKALKQDSVLIDLDRKLASAPMPLKLDKSAAKLVELSNAYRERQVDVTHKVSELFRSLDSSMASKSQLVDQLQSIGDEIRIYEDRLQAEVTSEHLFDNILRAMQRKCNAALQLNGIQGAYADTAARLRLWTGEFK